MNHFFALELSKEARRTVWEVADEWKHQLIPASWYDPADYHITLKFLGNLDEAEQPRLITAALPLAAEAKPFTVQAARFGGFPDMIAPSVLWAGVQISPELDLLSTHLDAAMAVLGFRADRRRYQPHITVARCRLRTSHSSAWPLPSERLFAPFTADRFVLMQTLPPESRANGGKARYNTVHTFPFGDGQISKVS